MSLQRAVPKCSRGEYLSFSEMVNFHIEASRTHWENIRRVATVKVTMLKEYSHGPAFTAYIRQGHARTRSFLYWC